MTFQSKLLTEALSPNYGYVILTGTGMSLFQYYLIGNVMKARKSYDVQYPALYSDASKEFNCIQRSHQHYLEIYPLNMFLLMAGGLTLPLTSSIGGVIFLGGKYFYSKGYSSGDPQKRKQGKFGYLGSAMMLGATLYTSFKLINGGVCPLSFLKSLTK